MLRIIPITGNPSSLSGILNERNPLFKLNNTIFFNLAAE